MITSLYYNGKNILDIFEELECFTVSFSISYSQSIPTKRVVRFAQNNFLHVVPLNIFI